jgi:dTDP-glucose 4,6-dehydratase
MRTLVTGGAGFIGSNFVRLLLAERPGAEVLNLDLLTYAGNLASLEGVDGDPRYLFARGDIADPQAVEQAFARFRPEAVVHFAAESHVDRSIADPAPFVRTNVTGTAVLLDAALRHKVSRFVHVSTDEVYGSLGEEDPPFTESHPLRANSPYSASKAGSDLLALAWARTYGLPVSLTRCSNNYGPYQFPEKLVPLMIRNALAGEPLPVYGDGRNIRDGVFVDDHCRAVLAVLERGEAGEVYNIGGNAERRNIDVVRTILRLLDRDESLIRFVADRPGHDWRYAMDIGRISSRLGWAPAVSFEEGMARTVGWYVEHQEWVRQVASGEYLAYHEKPYGSRLV